MCQKQSNVMIPARNASFCTAVNTNSISSACGNISTLFKSVAEKSGMLEGPVHIRYLQGLSALLNISFIFCAFRVHSHQRLKT